MKRTKSFLYLIITLLVLTITMPVTASAAVKLSSESVSLLVGKKKTLKVTGTTEKVTWSSSKTSVATVSANGVVKAKKKGTAYITAKVDGVSLRCKVTVKQPVTKIVLNKSSYFLMPGKTLSLKATITPANASNKTVTWSSSNKSVAKVSSKGVVTAVSKGNATITAKAKDGSGIKAICKIIVLKGAGTSATTTTTTTSTATTTTQSSKVNTFIKALEKYSSIITREVSEGKDWTYRNSKPSKLFSEAVSNNNRVTNCALIATWALKEVGILSYKQSIWGESYGTIHYSGTGTEAAIKSGCEIIQVNDTVCNLVANGKLKRGDILIYNFGSTGHTNVFNGYDKTSGVYKFFDAGRNGQNCVKGSDGQYHFKSLNQTSTTGSNTVAYIIRIK